MKGDNNISKHIQVFARPVNKPWWKFWDVKMKLTEGTDYILDGYKIKCINPQIRHGYTLKIEYKDKF